MFLSSAQVPHVNFIANPKDFFIEVDAMDGIQSRLSAQIWFIEKADIVFIPTQSFIQLQTLRVKDVRPSYQ